MQNAERELSQKKQIKLRLDEVEQVILKQVIVIIISIILELSQFCYSRMAGMLSLVMQGVSFLTVRRVQKSTFCHGQAPASAIHGGAKFIVEEYIKNGQNSVYLQGV